MPHSTTEHQLLRIVRCQELAKGNASPCHKIISTQEGVDDKTFQVPEPWRGRIDEAKLLFVSSNPSVNHEDDSPATSATDEEIIAYYQAGFAPQFPKIGLKSGRFSDQHVRFWASCRARAVEVLGRKKVEIKPGIDFAMTEIVHCKSRGEQGVVEARPMCVSLHFEATMRASAATVIVVLGKKTLDAIQSLSPELAGLETAPIETLWMGRSRHVIYLPHPNARAVKKSIKGFYPERANEYLSRLQQALA